MKQKPVQQKSFIFAAGLCFWLLVGSTNFAYSAPAPTDPATRRLAPQSNQLQRPTRKTESTQPFDLNSASTRRVVSSLAVVLGTFLIIVVLTRLQSRGKGK